MNTAVPQPILAAIAALPGEVTSRSGSIFYSSQPAFTGNRPLYVLGLNPGGCPEEQAQNTIARHHAGWLTQTKPYSSYVDEKWEGKEKSEHGLQPRIRHMFERLDRDLQITPASNVVFVRSRDEASLASKKNSLIEVCWPVHQAVIDTLGVQVVLCLGKTAGQWAREALGAQQFFDAFKESNSRGWVSEAHLAPSGKAVVTLTHPGRVDWRNPNADPTPLVAKVLDHVNA